MQTLPEVLDEPEAALIERARQGDGVAFESIVSRYQRRVYAVAWRILRRHDLADDVVQEAFLRAWRKLDRFDTQRPFGPWIVRIAANLACDQFRGKAAREESLDPERPDPPAPTPDPLAGVLAGEAREALDRALAELPAAQRSVLVLRAAEGLSYREIAEALALSPGTVMSRLFRARERLLRALAPHFRALETRGAAGARP